MKPHESMLALEERISRSIVGQESIVGHLVIGLLANGNLLLEGLPGLAKPLLSRALPGTGRRTSPASSLHRICCPPT